MLHIFDQKRKKSTVKRTQSILEAKAQFRRRASAAAELVLNSVQNLIQKFDSHAARFCRDFVELNS